MSKELEALNNIVKYGYLMLPNENEELKNIIETALKEKEKQDEILRIIKEKRVDIDMFMKCEDLDSYNYNIMYWHGNTLTQEEYDLLKEVLLWLTFWEPY